MEASVRRRSTVVTVGAVALVAASLSGCSSGPDYAGVCVDRTTTKRLPDRDCDDDGSGSAGGGRWYYVRAGSRAPAVGAPVSGGSFAEPSAGSVARGGVSESGGTISRGGFAGGHGSFGG